MYLMRNISNPVLTLYALRRMSLMLMAVLITLSVATPANAGHTNIRNFFGFESGRTLSGAVDIGARVSGDVDELYFSLVGPVENPGNAIEVQRSGRRPSFMVDADGQPAAWDTTTVTNGLYTLTCFTKDEAGDMHRSRSIQFRVENEGGAVDPDSPESPQPEASEPEAAQSETIQSEASAVKTADTSPLAAGFSGRIGTYQVGSGKAITLAVTGTPAKGQDVLVLAWSDAEGRMVDHFAFSMTEGPWEVPASKLNTLPLGKISLQVLVRSNGRTQTKEKQQFELLAPAASFDVAFVDTPAQYIKGSGQAIRLKANGDVPAGSVVRVAAWSQTTESHVDAFGMRLADEALVIPASKLEMLPAGKVRINVMVGAGDQIKTVSHMMEIAAPAPAEPDTDVTPVDLPGSDPILLPADGDGTSEPKATFTNKPATYAPGTGGDIAFEVTDLPKDGDVLVIAWSDEKGALVGEFAHYLQSGPWRISASKLALLPAGQVELQLIVRGGESRPKTIHRMLVLGSTTSNPTQGDEPTDTPSGDSSSPDTSGDTPGDTGSDTPTDPTPADPTNNDDEPIDVPFDPTPTPTPTPDVDFDGTEIGFTTLTRSSDTRVIYVSKSKGNDSNDGLSEQKPVRSLARGHDLLRNGKPDWLLLKAGDVWDGESFTEFTKSSGSVSKPMVVSVYGEGVRPLIMPKAGEHGFKTRNDRLQGLVIKGLHFYAVTRDVASSRYVERRSEATGFNIRIGGGEGKYIKGVVIEDCKVTHFDDNILVADDWARTQGEGKAGRIQVTIRRNIVRFAQGDDSHSVGIYIEGTHDSVIEQNFLDHNGWHPANGIADKNKRSHNIYAQRFNGPIVVRHNIITRGGAHGLQLRAGGDILNNLFARNAMAFYTSINDSRANYNVILESIDIDPDQGDEWRGMGINGFGLKRYEVIGNVVSTRLGKRQVPGIEVAASQLIVKNNTVYKWRDGNDGNVSITANGAEMSGNLIPENFNWQVPPFIDPDRNLDTYAKSIGINAGTTEAFFEAVANRPRGQWVDEFDPATVCRYIRNGFELIPHD